MIGVEDNPVQPEPEQHVTSIEGNAKTLFVKKINIYKS